MQDAKRRLERTNAPVDEIGWRVWLGNVASIFVSLAGLLKTLDKEKGKPPEARTHGQYLKDCNP